MWSESNAHWSGCDKLSLRLQLLFKLLVIRELCEFSHTFRACRCALIRRSHIPYCNVEPFSHSICGCGPLVRASSAMWSDFIGTTAIGLSQTTVCAWFTYGQSNMWLLIAKSGEMKLLFDLYNLGMVLTLLVWCNVSDRNYNVSPVNNITQTQ